MNDIERTQRQRELEAAYQQAIAKANDQTRDGLAHYLLAAQAQKELAELAISEEAREMHLRTYLKFCTHVAEHEKALSAAAAREETPAAPPRPVRTPVPPQPAPAKAQAAARRTPEAAPEKSKEPAKEPAKELYGFDPENCRMKEVPSVTFDDIIGSTATVDALRRTFSRGEKLLRFTNLAKKAPKAAAPAHHMLYGPPGTGKSFLCQAIANQVMTQHPNTQENPNNSAFFVVKSSDIISPFVGVAEKRLQALFDYASTYAHCVICIDEMDRLCPDRNASASEAHANQDALSLLTLLLQLIDGICGKCKAMIFCATNYPWKVDVAMRDRLGSKLLLDLPNEQAKRIYLQKNLAQFLAPTPEKQQERIEELLGRLEHASYRELDALAHSVSCICLDKTAENHPDQPDVDVFDPISPQELEAILQTVHSSSDPDYLARLRDPSRWAGDDPAFTASPFQFILGKDK